MNTFTRNFLTVGFCLFLFNSCKKENSNTNWKVIIERNQYATISELFRDVDKVAMQEIISSKSELQGQIFLRSMANKIASFLAAKRSLYMDKDFVNNAESIVLLGLLFLGQEHNIINNSFDLRKSDEVVDGDPFDCFIGAVSGLIGIAEGKKIWQDMASGAIADSVVGALKTIARRVGSVITVVTTVWGFVSCLTK